MGRDFKKLSLISGFSLLEMIAVLTIIGIFSGFLFPLGQQIVYKANLAKDAHNLRQIALSYCQLLQLNESLDGLKNVINSNDFAVTLARSGGINEASCYSSFCSKNKPKSTNIVDTIGNIIGDFNHLPIDWVCLSPLPTNCTLSTTPALYSQGLNIETGLWEPDSLYGTRGGFIAFLDGHVQFFNNLEGQLVHFKTKRPTKNITEAVPNYTHAYTSSGRIW